MVVCMFVTTPLMFQFANFDSLKGQQGYFINKFSLGNLGGSSTLCTQVDFMESDAHFSLKCNEGLLDLDAIDSKSGYPLYEAGVINTD